MTKHVFALRPIEQGDEEFTFLSPSPVVSTPLTLLRLPNHRPSMNLGQIYVISGEIKTATWPADSRILPLSLSLVEQRRPNYIETYHSFPSGLIVLPCRVKPPGNFLVVHWDVRMISFLWRIQGHLPSPMQLDVQTHTCETPATTYLPSHSPSLPSRRRMNSPPWSLTSYTSAHLPPPPHLYLADLRRTSELLVQRA